MNNTDCKIIGEITIREKENNIVLDYRFKDGEMVGSFPITQKDIDELHKCITTREIT